ncbi:hypothetical protein HK105_203867 [Polyrhizophydium stewartii]|uniref:Uncharacterized protein n=1 Tax=Polyrhizophydium stewartii TaxID=2732419 RepID=A0ABR4NA97_9FUNG|nr:hypothetical protein HK105_004054 [Polyrhizophydium stewartii]
MGSGASRDRAPEPEPPHLVGPYGVLARDMVSASRGHSPVGSGAASVNFDSEASFRYTQDHDSRRVRRHSAFGGAGVVAVDPAGRVSRLVNSGSEQGSLSRQGSSRSEALNASDHIRALEEELARALADKRRFAYMLSEAEAVSASRGDYIRDLEAELRKRLEEVDLRSRQIGELQAALLATRASLDAHREIMEQREAALMPLVEHIFAILSAVQALPDSQQHLGPLPAAPLQPFKAFMSPLWPRRNSQAGSVQPRSQTFSARQALPQHVLDTNGTPRLSTTSINSGNRAETAISGAGPSLSDERVIYIDTETSLSDVEYRGSFAANTDADADAPQLSVFASHVSTSSNDPSAAHRPAQLPPMANSSRAQSRRASGHQGSVPIPLDMIVHLKNLLSEINSQADDMSRALSNAPPLPNLDKDMLGESAFAGIPKFASASSSSSSLGVTGSAPGTIPPLASPAGTQRNRGPPRLQPLGEPQSRLAPPQ